MKHEKNLPHFSPDQMIYQPPQKSNVQYQRLGNVHLRSNTYTLCPVPLVLPGWHQPEIPQKSNVQHRWVCDVRWPRKSFTSTVTGSAWVSTKNIGDCSNEMGAVWTSLYDVTPISTEQLFSLHSCFNLWMYLFICKWHCTKCARWEQLHSRLQTSWMASHACAQWCQITVTQGERLDSAQAENEMARLHSCQIKRAVELVAGACNSKTIWCTTKVWESEDKSIKKTSW